MAHQEDQGRAHDHGAGDHGDGESALTGMRRPRSAFAIAVIGPQEAVEAAPALVALLRPPAVAAVPVGRSPHDGRPDCGGAAALDE